MDEKREKTMPQGAERATQAAKKHKNRVKLDKKQAFKEGILGLGFGILAFLLGRCEMLFMTYPLGFALLAVVGRQMPYVFVGLVASAFFESGVSVVNICAAVLIVIARLICRYALDSPDAKNEFAYATLPDKIGFAFSENLYLRMMSGAIGAFLVGIYNIVLGGFRFYDLFGAIFYIIITPVAVFLYGEYFIIKEKIALQKLAFEVRKDEERLYELACAALICSLIYSLGGTVIVGLSLPVFVAFFLTLYYSGTGVVKGIIMGRLFGLATGPIYAPLYAFAAIACACLRTVSVFAASLASCIVGLIWGIYVGGISALATLFPALLSASMTYCTAEKVKLFSDVNDFFKSDPALEESCALGIVAQDRAKNSVEKMRGISDSFSALSEVFYNLSSKLKRPAMLDLRRICDKTFEEYCPDCDEYDICFGAEYATTLEQMKKITVQLHTAGKADAQKLNEQFRSRCLYCPSIIEDINKSCGVATKKALRNEKTEIFALDYDAISKILNDAIKENENDYKADYSMGKKLSAAIAEEGFGDHAVMVWGTRKKKILAKGLDLSENAGGVENLRKKLEKTSGYLLEDPEFELAFGSVNMQTATRRRFSVESAFATSASLDGGDVCGDTVSVFENKNDYVYSLISDGMGTGQNAAFTSEMCNVFLRNMLNAGNHMETSLRMLNSVIRAKSNSSSMECSATVDLLELDLYSGAITLVKSGAAPTYVLRKGNIFKLQAQSIPIGIMRSLDAKQLQMNCIDGDIIVMVSDGVVRGGDECLWLTQMISDENEWKNPLPDVAQRIVDRAKSQGGSDDISVVLLKVHDER